MQSNQRLEKAPPAHYIETSCSHVGSSPVTTEEHAQPKPLEHCKTCQDTCSHTREADQSSDVDDIALVTWSQKESVPEATRCVVLRDVPRHHGLRHSKENLTINLNKVTDDVLASASSLHDATLVNQVTLNLNLPENEPVEKTNLPGSDPVERETAYTATVYQPILSS